MPTTKNKNGLVALVFKKKIAEVRTNQTQIVDNLHKIMGSKPTLAVCVEGVKSLPDDT